jgi:hypothetical protein
MVLRRWGSCKQQKVAKGGKIERKKKKDEKKKQKWGRIRVMED